MSVARYDALKLAEAMLSGERSRLARMLEGLRGEGEAPPRVLWILAEEIRAICRVQNGIAAGRSLAEVLREARVWGDARQSLVGRARRSSRARRCSPRSSTPPKSIASSKGSSKRRLG